MGNSSQNSEILRSVSPVNNDSQECTSHAHMHHHLKIYVFVEETVIQLTADLKMWDYQVC